MIRAIALTALLAPAFVAAETYEIDSSHAEVVFRINHLGFSYTFGKFNDISGEVTFDPENLADASATVHIDPASINFGHEGKEEHLRSDDFFDVENFPKATYQSTSIEATGENTYRITGDLTVHGVTLPVTLDATLNKVGKHPFRDKMGIGFSATTTLNRSDFGVDRMVPAVGDDVQLWVELEAYKPAE